MVQMPREIPSRFKLELREFLMHNLFENHRSVVDAKKYDILVEHYNLVGLASTRMMYRGEVFTIPEEYTEKDGRWDRRLPLHESLIERMDSLTKEIRLLEFSAAKVGAYITRCANACDTVEDFFVVMPDELVEILPQVMLESRVNSVRKISPEKLQSFTVTNKDGYQALQERLMMQLLMGGR